MTMHLKNAFSGRLETFEPESSTSEISVYCCGATVRDATRLRHVRTYIFQDVLLRIFRHHLKFGTRSVLNVTDAVSSKNERRRPFERAPTLPNAAVFSKTLRELGIENVHLRSKSAQTFGVMRDFVSRLRSNLSTYQSPSDPRILYVGLDSYLSTNGPVFRNVDYLGEKYDRSDAKRKPRLRRRPSTKVTPSSAFCWNERDADDEEEEGDAAVAAAAAADDDEAEEEDDDDASEKPTGRSYLEKRNLRDVRLCRWTWSCEVAENPRRVLPEWHTECAALASFHLRRVVDVHVGERDLALSHHSNEIALQRVVHGSSGRRVRFCLLVGTVSTSDSLTTMEGVLAKGYSPAIVRWLFLTRPYESATYVTEKDLEKAREAYGRFASVFKEVKKRYAALRKRKTARATAEFDRSHRSDGEKEEEEEDDGDFCVFERRVNDCILDNLDLPLLTRTVESYLVSLKNEFDEENVCFFGIRRRINHVEKILQKYLGLDTDRF